ncbi:MAG: pentapeptide repeat-containing protein [Rhizobium sp.]
MAARTMTDWAKVTTGGGTPGARTPLPTATILLAVGLACVTWTSAAAADCGSSPEPGLDWSACSKNNIMLDGSNLQGANLAGADLSVTGLPNSNLDGAQVEKANLMRAWFTGSTMKNANFARIQAYRSGFSKVIAEGASFASAELQRANFAGAKLAKADFQKAELGRANFDKAVLSGTNFTLANLSRANLGGTTSDAPINFDRAFMFLTNIEGLDLSNAVGLLQPQLDLACGDDKTKLPKDLKKPAGWPCGAD